ncbi:hypothetical protein D3C71_1042390 [compost metagenome]|jgi:hypothetical protein
MINEITTIPRAVGGLRLPGAIKQCLAGTDGSAKYTIGEGTTFSETILNERFNESQYTGVF